jgi:hypothetical protein
MPIVLGIGNAIGWASVDADAPLEFSFLLWNDPNDILLIDSGGGKILLFNP